MAKCMITTIDNPFNPLSDFTRWLSFEIEHGYDSTSYLAKFVRISDSMSDEEKENETEKAIDFIVSSSPLPIYYKVTDPNLKPTTMSIAELYDIEET